MDRTTPSAKGNNWRRPKKRGCKASSRRTTPSASQLELAERVKFPEKNAWFGYFEVPFGGEGVHAPFVPTAPPSSLLKQIDVLVCSIHSHLQDLEFPFPG